MIKTLLDELHRIVTTRIACSITGFVTEAKPDITPDIQARMDELSEIHEVEVRILSFKEWYQFWCERVGMNNDLGFAKQWLIAYVESLCQKRRTMAPIDEPSDEWVRDLINNLDDLLK